MMDAKVLAETMRTGGLNWWFAGMQHTLSYMRSGQPVLTDRSTLAATRSSPFHRGRIIVMIYSSHRRIATTDVTAFRHYRFPPEISKAYVVDLTPDLSLVKRMVDGGANMSS